MEQKRNNLTLGDLLVSLRNMVDTFVAYNGLAWEKYQKQYENEHGFSIGVPLSLHSFLGSDLLIDFAYLAKEVENHEAFVREIWLRSQGTQCIKSDEDRQNCRRAFGDIVGKIGFEFDGERFYNLRWIDDEDCRIRNILVKEDRLYTQWF